MYLYKSCDVGLPQQQFPALMHATFLLLQLLNYCTESFNNQSQNNKVHDDNMYVHIVTVSQHGVKEMNNFPVL